jgi:hypothetical protein
MMKHQPFETWVFIQDELDTDQKSQLLTHLQGCEACESLSASLFQLEKEVMNSTMLTPQRGFTNRWRVRLSEQQQRRKHRHTSILFGGLTLTASVLFIPFALRALLLVLSPENVLFSTVETAVEWWSWIGFTGDVVTAFVSSILETFPPAWWVISSLILMILGVIWFISMNRFSPSTTIERR